MHLSNRQLFLHHVAQTSPSPIGLEIVRAEGIYLYDADGKRYVDLISGFSVMNIGHGNAAVREAIAKQTEAYMHVMVYGEMIQSPQVQYASLLTKHLPGNLNCVYFTNSGAEAVEGAMKLSKRVTGRSRIVAFNNAYHGSTQGALSVMGSEYWRQAFRPLLPDVYHAEFNSVEALEAIDENTACVIVEMVQAEAGAAPANRQWIQALSAVCKQHGCLLVADEIQTGFGRTGKLWAFEHYDIVPDVLLLGKALGGGLPLGAFISGYDLMQQLTHKPVLGHITTFGGHPVCCAAGMAAFKQLLAMCEMQQDKTRTLPRVVEASTQLRSKLETTGINVTGQGMLMAMHLESDTVCNKVAKQLQAAGIITDWFLFAPHALRIAPPLIITEDECLAITEKIKLVLHQLD